MKCDLHCHSDYSFDSTQSVDDILFRAKKAGIDVLAICDHNVVQGSLDAQMQTDVEIISGIEIDCFCKEAVIHLTAYGMDCEDQSFSKLAADYMSELDRIGSTRLKRIEDRYNCKLDIMKIMSLTHRGYPYTNVEIERVLFEDIQHPALVEYQTGVKSSNPIANFYWDHLSIGKWGYVEMKLPDFKKIINWIHDLKGIVICAHPKVTIGRDEVLIHELIEAGIDGFEVYCSYHNQDDEKYYKKIVNENNLCMTVGSDFHGSTKPNIELGQTGYEEDCTQLVEALKNRIKRQREKKVENETEEIG